jgi:xanthine dehydrogenase accessory factor
VGIQIIITELEQPLAVRRGVAFSEAVYQETMQVEGVQARRVQQPEEILQVLRSGEIPVLVDPDCLVLKAEFIDIAALVDARMTKRPPGLKMNAAPFMIGLGPGFVAGENCHAAIETNRGHFLGRVIWKGSPEPNTGIPGKVGEKQAGRVLRAPDGGVLRTEQDIGDLLSEGQRVASVSGSPILAPFDGVLRGILRSGTPVKAGMKVGDVDPRANVDFAFTVSDKSLAIGGGVLEALLTKPDIRRRLWK